MQSDEQAIRDVIARWMQASKAGDTAAVLSLMDEDVVFLLPGRPPMRGREDFAEASKGMDGKFEMDGVSDIQEIQVDGSWAYVWSHLTISVKPLDGSPPVRRSGNILSIFRKLEEGRWVLYRDANMLTVEK